MTKRSMKNDLEPFVVVILISITVIEFLILAGGLKEGDFIGTLTAMISLMIFGSTLLIISLIARIHDLFRSTLTLLSSENKSTNNKSKNQKKKKKKRR